jgi:hypothetical protein
LLDQVSIGEKKISFPYYYNSHKKRIINEYYAFLPSSMYTNLENVFYKQNGNSCFIYSEDTFPGMILVFLLIADYKANGSFPVC